MTPEQQEFSVVAVGDFNPAIFQPQWFSGNGLLPPEEVESAEIEVIHKQLASFSVSGMNVQVDRSRLALQTEDESIARLLRDIAHGTLMLLEHTPLRAIGFNRNMHFQLATEQAAETLIAKFAPKQPWPSCLANVTPLQVAVRGERAGYPNSRIQVKLGQTGPMTIGLQVNQHYPLSDDEHRTVVDQNLEALRAIADDWSSFLKYALEFSADLIKIGLEESGT